MKKVACLIFAVMIFFGTVNVSALELSAKSAIVINGDTGEVIFSRNPDIRLPMASTTKIMTSLLLCESGDLEKTVDVTEEMLCVEGSSMGLSPGDKVTYRDLLYGMLLASGNDAANVTAYALGGSIRGFTALMNRKATELGLKNTSFETPSGLDGENHYTTASDLAKLARIAMQNPDFAAAASSERETLCFGTPECKRTLTNHNKLLKLFDGTVGVKTGFTKKSGRCLVSAAKRNGKYVIAVTLNDPNDWEDHADLLEYGFEKINLTVLKPEKSEYEIPVMSSGKETVKVKILPYTVSYFNTEGFSVKVNLPEFLYAPVTKGDNIGSVIYEKNGETVAEKPIVAEKNIYLKYQDIGTFEKLKEYFKRIFSEIWES